MPTPELISDLTAVTLPLDGSELLEIARDGLSYKIHSGDVAQATPSAIPVISSPATTALDPQGLYFEVTSAGSAGVEYVNLPNPTLDGNGYNAALIGRRVIIYFKTRTDPADTIVVKVGGVVSSINTLQGALSIANPLNKTDASGIVLGFEGASVALVWAQDKWLIDVTANDFNTSAVFISELELVYGAPDVAGATNGTEVFFIGGQAGGSGNGGNVYLRAGAALGAGANGNVFFDTLPVTDPLIAGSVWNNLGVPALSGTVKAAPSTVAALPAAGTAGRRAMVNNALAPAFGAVVAGAGAVIVPVYDDGTNWRVG